MSLRVLPVILPAVPWPHGVPESHQGGYQKGGQRKAVPAAKANQGLQLAWLAQCQISAKRLWCGKPCKLSVGALCVNGNTIQRKGVKVRVDLELLRSLRPLCVLHFPGYQANAAVGGKMCIHAGHTHPHTHTPCWVWKQDPRGSTVSPSGAQMMLNISKM